MREPEVLPAGRGASWDWRGLKRLATWRPSRGRPPLYRWDARPDAAQSTAIAGLS